MVSNTKINKLPFTVTPYWLYLVGIATFIVVFAIFFMMSYLAAMVFVLIFAVAIAIYASPLIGAYLVIISTPLLNLGFRYDNPVRFIGEFVPISLIPMVFTYFLYLSGNFLMHKEESKEPSKEPRLDSIIKFFILFYFGYICFSLAWSIDLVHGIQTIINLSFCFMTIMILPRILTSENKIKWILGFYPLFSVLLIILLILSGEYTDFIETFKIYGDFKFVTLLHNVTSSDPDKTRLGGFAPVNIAADILAFLLYMNVYIFYRSGWKVRCLIVINSLMIMYCTLKTGSKAGAASLLVGLSFLIVAVPEFRRHFIKIVSVGMLLLGALMAIAGKVLMKRIELVMGSNFLEDRLEWWGVGFDNLYKTYGFGLGTGGFPKAIDPVPAAHSIYFSVLFENGYIGLALAVLILTLIVIKVARALAKMVPGNLRVALYCLLAALITTCVHGIMDFEYTFLHLWVVIALMFAIIEVVPRKSEYEIETKYRAG